MNKGSKTGVGPHPTPGPCGATPSPLPQAGEGRGPGGGVRAFKETELGPLPVEWEVARLGEIASISGGGSAPQGDQFFGGPNPFVRVKHLSSEGFFVKRWDWITDEAVEQYRLRPYPRGTIVFPKSGASIRLEKRAVLPVEAYLVSHLCAVLPGKGVDGDFLFYALKTIRFAAKKAAGYPTLTLTEIRETAIPLPPLPEQRRIAYVLRTIQRAIEATDRVIAAARELKRSLMHYLFTYGPVPFDQAGQVPLKETEIELVPERWEVVRLGEVATVKGGKRLPKGHRFSQHPTPFPYIRVTDFADWSVNLSDLKYLTPEDREKIKRYVITADDVYISIAGTIGLVGTIPDSLNGANLTENAARIIINDKQRLDKQYLVGFLASDRGQRQINARATKTSQPKLALARIRQLPLALPPLVEQRRIAHILYVVNRKIKAEEQRKSALQALFRTMLHELMTGRVRV